MTLPSAGKVVAVLGHNGAGKTTLLRVAIGLIKPPKGHVLLDGEDITSLAPQQARRAGLAYVPQGQQCFPQLTTLENLQLVADGRPTGRAKIDEQLAASPPWREFPPEGRPALRRPAPAARDRPRPHHRAEAAHPRRADRGHPAHDRRRDRAHHRAAGRARDLSVLLVEQHIGFALRATSSYYVLESGRVTSHGEGGAERGRRRPCGDGGLSACT